MDEYTKKTKEWLNNRFRVCDEQGIYVAHQPIYGFRNEPCEPGQMSRYLITYHIMQELANLDFKSFLDVGGAEGYKAYLTHLFFGAMVKTSDLSDEACKRAEEIFNLSAVVADIHTLPFKDNQFDVLLCSESLEHVTDYKKATEELLRVANKAVIITVPHEPKDITDHNQAIEMPHGHIHSFDSKSFDYLQAEGYTVIPRKILSSLAMIPAFLIDAAPRKHSENWKHPKLVTQIYNLLVPIARFLLGKKSAVFLINVNRILCNILPYHKANMFIIFKNGQNLQKKKAPQFSPRNLLDFSVPRHYIKKAKSPSCI